MFELSITNHTLHCNESLLTFNLINFMNFRSAGDTYLTISMNFHLKQIATP